MRTCARFEGFAVERIFQRLKQTNFPVGAIVHDNDASTIKHVKKLGQCGLNKTLKHELKKKTFQPTTSNSVFGGIG